MMVRFVTLAFSFILLTSCIRGLQGEFAWASVYDQDMDAVERDLNQPISFRFAREHLYFSEVDTIWWIYRIDRKGYVKGDILAVLYSLSGSAEPVEIDLRHVKIERSNDARIIRQHYNSLPIGDYMLKIADRERPFDQVQFSVIADEELKTPEGVLAGDEYTGQGEEDVVRYSHSRTEEAL